MPKYLIERTLPGIGSLNDDEIRTAAGRSNKVLADMAPRAQWQHSYVTADKLFCVYVADDEATLHEHAERGGFPLDVAYNVVRVIDPVTAE